MNTQERSENSIIQNSKENNETQLSTSIGLGALKLNDISMINNSSDLSKSGSATTELVFTDIPGYSNGDKQSPQNDQLTRPENRETLIASARGDAAFNETKNIYENALHNMVMAGHHLPGGDFNSGYGNILQNSGLSNRTWVCAEQAEFLAKALRNDPRLSDSKVFLLHTKDYEHMFVGLQDPDGKMVYMDPWREKPPSRISPNEIEGKMEFH